MIEKVEKYLKDYDLTGLEISIKSPDDAMQYSLDRMRKGLDTILYRDWETDRKSTRLNSSHSGESRMPSSA